MSRPADPPDPIAQLGEVLATAEHHVQQIVTAAEQRADERVRQAQQRVDARAAELNGIADELLTASAAVHHQLQRLRALAPLEAMPDQPAPAAPPSAAPPTTSPSNASPSNGSGPSAAVPASAPPAAAPAWPEPIAAPPTHAPPEPAPTVPPHDHDLPLIDSSDTYDAGSPSAEQLDSARLVALSMAAGGRSRAEVEAHLRNELGISDYGPLIDYVFGISTPASVVPSWPPRRRRRGD
jgi:hypothetical protein